MYKHISLSITGFNIPYYQGVINRLQKNNMISKSTHFTGCSGGALTSILTACNIDPLVQLEYTKDIFNNTALFSILAIPIKLENIVMDPVLGPDDTYEKLSQRVRERGTKK